MADYLFGFAANKRHSTRSAKLLNLEMQRQRKKARTKRDDFIRLAATRCVRVSCVCVRLRYIYRIL